MTSTTTTALPHQHWWCGYDDNNYLNGGEHLNGGANHAGGDANPHHGLHHHPTIEERRAMMSPPTDPDSDPVEDSSCPYHPHCYCRTATTTSYEPYYVPSSTTSMTASTPMESCDTSYLGHHGETTTGTTGHPYAHQQQWWYNNHHGTSVNTGLSDSE